MARVNLTEHSQVESKAHPRLELELAVRLTAQGYLKLIEALISWEPTQELGITFSSSHLIYLKYKESDNRSLLAHPEADQWVGTIAATPLFFEQFKSAILNLKPGDAAMTLSACGKLTAFSNLEISFEVHP